MAISLTERTDLEPSAVALLRVRRGRDGSLEMAGRAWRDNGALSARYWSKAVKEKREPSGIFYYWTGDRPRDPDAPQLHGTGEIRLEATDRASGYFTTLSDGEPKLKARTAGVYLRADPEDLKVLDGNDDQERSRLIADRLRHWNAVKRG